MYPPGEQNAFCMSLMTSAVRAGLKVKGAGKAARVRSLI
jgi:hypothetical protein